MKNQTEKERRLRRLPHARATAVLLQNTPLTNSTCSLPEPVVASISRRIYRGYSVLTPASAIKSRPARARESLQQRRAICENQVITSHITGCRFSIPG